MTPPPEVILELPTLAKMTIPHEGSFDDRQPQTGVVAYLTLRLQAALISYFARRPEGKARKGFLTNFRMELVGIKFDC